MADNDDERRWTDKAQRKAEEEYQRLTQTKCRGCGERLNDGCLPGCTDRD